MAVNPMGMVAVPPQVAALGYQQMQMRKRIAMQMMQQRAAAQARAMAQQQQMAQAPVAPTAVDPGLDEMREEAARQERLRLLMGGTNA
jgi:hypothetical protein